MEDRYPKLYRKNIRILKDRLCTDADTAYRMMLMTAMLMDLRPEDDQVVDYILTDCDLEVQR
jgi:hypothetical protein